MWIVTAKCLGVIGGTVMSSLCQNSVREADFWRVLQNISAVTTLMVAYLSFEFSRMMLRRGADTSATRETPEAARETVDATTIGLYAG